MTVVVQSEWLNGIIREYWKMARTQAKLNFDYAGDAWAINVFCASMGSGIEDLYIDFECEDIYQYSGHYRVIHERFVIQSNMLIRGNWYSNLSPEDIEEFLIIGTLAASDRKNWK